LAHLSLRLSAEHPGPFDLGEDFRYQRWRDWKLRHFPPSAQDLVVEVRDLRRLTSAECQAIQDRCLRASAAIVACRGAGPLLDKEAVRRLGEQFGLHRLDANLCADEDGITSLQVSPTQRQQGYIPYTNLPLSWHTDGYYNPPGREIRSFILLCLQDAAEGGESAFFDHEMAYLLLREADPDYVRALMEPDSMTIPPNVEEGAEIRAAQPGPVFSLDPATARLHMRYTARKRNIVWRSDAATQAALSYLTELLASSPYVLRHRLEPGQGIICNNLLHNRTGFVDDAARGKVRLLYRARYYDRVAGLVAADAA
jgi:alpha-ketoglutarate-dependent taurine dioxygenase